MRPRRDSWRNPPAGRPVQTIEKTSKSWKALMLLAGLIMLGGCAATFAGHGDEHVMKGGALVFGVGLLLMIYSKIGAWWHHG